MSAEDTPKPDGPHIIVDEDWKSRVKAEDAAFDEVRQTTDENDRQADVKPEDLPPASLATLVASFSTPAMVALGLLPNPATDKTEIQLPLAKHCIDSLAVLEDKTRGNLSQTEAGFLESTLHQLRLAYVEQSKQVASPSAASTNPDVTP